TLKTILRNPGATLGLLGVLAFLVIGIAAPFISPFDPNKQNLRAIFRPPSRTHPFGTDQFGRDILSRVFFGARTSLIVATSAIALAMLVGALTGVSVGYRGGWPDEVIMRCVDVLLTFPDIFLAIIVTAVVPPGLGTTILAIAVYNLPQFVRVGRAAALSVRENAFVEAARASGASSSYIVLRHILPNSLAPIVVLATLRTAASILTAAGLSFLGLGVPPPTPEWGTMISESRVYIVSAPWTSLFPGAAIFLTVLSFNLLGDGINDALNPRRRAFRG
ncbi:MAG: ABC transporter permease, partial [Candidatus Bipolaricaulota bacterium]|nr:ABC transporter permease [Candidatus Bipolaricaulota bacterium]